MTGPDSSAEASPAGKVKPFDRREFLKLSSLLPIGLGLGKILPKREVKGEEKEITKEQVRRGYVFEGMRLYGRVFKGEVLFNLGQKEAVAMALAFDDMKQAIDKDKGKEIDWVEVIGGVMLATGALGRFFAKKAAGLLSEEDNQESKEKREKIAGWFTATGATGLAVLLLDLRGDAVADKAVEREKLSLTGAEGKMRQGVINQSLAFMVTDEGMATLESYVDLAVEQKLGTREEYMRKQLFMVSEAIDSIVYNNNLLVKGKEVANEALKHRMETWDWAGERVYSREEIIDLLIRDPELRQALRDYENLSKEEREKDDPF